MCTGSSERLMERLFLLYEIIVVLRFTQFESWDNVLTLVKELYVEKGIFVAEIVIEW